jgi:hypothetical protein
LVIQGSAIGGTNVAGNDRPPIISPVSDDFINKIARGKVILRGEAQVWVF